MRFLVLSFLFRVNSANLMTRGITGMNLNMLPRPNIPTRQNVLPRAQNLTNPRKKLSGSINTGMIPGLDLETSFNSIGDALSLLKPTTSSCSFYSPWTVGNCNQISQKVKKSYMIEENLFVCLADGTFSPYQNCDQEGKHCENCVFLDTGLLIPKKLLNVLKNRFGLNGTSLCPAVYQDEGTNPCRELENDDLDCGPREWTELRYE